MAELKSSGMRGLPVVARGNSFISGMDLQKVDEFLGLADRSTAEPWAKDAPLLPGRELVERSVKVVEAGARFMRQVPPAVYDHDIPGMQAPEAHRPLMTPDGRPVLAPNGKAIEPHRTYIGLARHIVGHGVKIKHILEDPGTTAFSRMETMVPIGEPDDELNAIQLAEIAERTAPEIRRAWERRSELDLERSLDAYWGTESVHTVLHRMLYSLVHHTRQLMSLLIELRIEPDGPLTDADYEGVGHAPRLWD